jgi:DNA primase catalytic core
MNQIGPTTLVVIDEAGMADTLSLDAVINHVIQAGGSVRLIGDDQQLAAIGAGGVLRDIQATHGALHLSELVRFTDPAEGSASLALREGHPEALGFYLDRDRIHVGTPDTMLDQLFQRWAEDRAIGLDSVMLAPTRDLVSQLNQRARDHRLTGTTPDAEVDLADGNRASNGDVIITRRNNRKLALNATDWVKNGDRWTIQTITAAGVRVRHTQTARHITLPHDYIAEWAELGYATTTHTAQGVTADTCHGMLTGDETRQQAYTMLTRGRRTNTCYLTVTGDGDPHTLIHPEVVHPATAVDQLEHILARDESPLSAATTLRQAGDPALLLGDACGRYADAIVFGADHTTSPADRHTIEVAAGRVVPGITKADAWPALFAQLLGINADHRDPIEALTRAAAEPIVAGRDPAAILASRLDDTSRRSGPLPWLNPIPASLTRHPVWGNYLAARAGLVRTLADQLRTQVEQRTTAPTWATDGVRPPTELVADIEIWRASNQIPDTDRRPTGGPQHTARSRRCQDRLDRRLGRLTNPALDEWGDLLCSLGPLLARDPYLPNLATRVGQAASAGIDIQQLLRRTAAAGPLPEEHTAAALWWRISGQLTPAVSQDLDSDHHLVTTWLPRLGETFGRQATVDLQQSPWWPALVTTIEHALQRGWTLDQLIGEAPTEQAGSIDACQAWVWRLSIATQNMPDEHHDDPRDEPPHDLTEGWTPPEHLIDMVQNVSAATDHSEPDPAGYQAEFEDPDAEAERILAIEAVIRKNMGPPEMSAAEIRRQQDRADAWRECRYTPERLTHINELTTLFYEARLPGSWAQPYLTGRLRQDITGHPDIRPGYAPDGWTSLVQHLRRLGVTDDEMLTAGVASRASTGRLIDRFRDRLIFPITHERRVLGFVARRNPAHADTDNRGPKYLNTAETPLFHKGDQLYVPAIHTGAQPALVEGPMDAIAVTVGTDGQFVGVAPLGTGLTEAQANQLVTMSSVPIIATDADAAGRSAAERDYWILASHSATPRSAHLPESIDPASLVSAGTVELLRNALASAPPTWHDLLNRGLAHDRVNLASALTVAASAPPSDWQTAITAIAESAGVDATIVRTGLAPLVRAWNTNPVDVARSINREPLHHQAPQHAHLNDAKPQPRAPYRLNGPTASRNRRFPGQEPATR